MNKTMNKIPAQPLKITLDNNISSFLELVANFKDIENHHRSIQNLMKKLFNTAKNVISTFTDEILIKDY